MKTGRGAMRRGLLRVLKIALLAYLGFGAVLYLAQRSFIYFPVPETRADVHPVEWVESGDARLKVWVVNPGKGRGVIYFGGNAEDVYRNAGDFAAWIPGRTVYLVNYRGYGGSSGTPSESALYGDALAVFDQVQRRHAGVAAIGRSLGSAVATYLASRRPVERLVLVTPLDSVLAVAERRYPIYPVEWMLKDRFDSIHYAPQVHAPVLMLIAGDDRVVPLDHSMRLADAFTGSRVEALLIAGSGHNGISGREPYWQAMQRFLRETAD